MRALRWRDLDELLAGERVAEDDAANPKTPTIVRRVPIIQPLRDDLLAWRQATPFQSPEAPFVPSQDGLPWQPQALRNWSRNDHPELLCHLRSHSRRRSVGIRRERQHRNAGAAPGGR